MSDRKNLQREYARHTIENKALAAWIKMGGSEMPNIDESEHLILLAPHKYGSGCCGWNHFYKLVSRNRTLAVFVVSNFYNPSLRKLSLVPSEIVEDRALPLDEFFNWEDEQDLLNAELRAAPAPVPDLPVVEDDIHQLIDDLDIAA